MIKKLYRLSITLCDKVFVCNNINDEDIIIKEFHYWDQANNWINNNFKKNLFHIDHIVGNQADGKMISVCDYYEKVFQWKRFWV